MSALLRLNIFDKRIFKLKHDGASHLVLGSHVGADGVTLVLMVGQAAESLLLGLYLALAGAVLLVLPVDHHPVTRVAVHAVLHGWVQVLVRLLRDDVLLRPDLPLDQVDLNVVIRKGEDPAELISLAVLGVVLLKVYRIHLVSVGDDRVDTGSVGYRSPGGVGSPLSRLIVETRDEAAVRDPRHDLAAVNTVRPPGHLTRPDSPGSVAPHVAVPGPGEGHQASKHIQYLRPHSTYSWILLEKARCFPLIL